MPRDVVMQDYLLTNEHFRHPPMPQSRTPKEALAVLWRVQEDFLTEALRAIDQDHGGIERYLSERLGLSDAARATLRARYLSQA